MKKIILIFILVSALFAEQDNNTTKINQEDLLKINKSINNNIWSKIYENYIIFKDLKKEDKEVLQKLIKLNQKEDKSKEDIKEINKLKERKLSLSKKLELISNYDKGDPFKQMITHPKIESVPNVDNPITIIEAVTFQETLKKQKEKYFKRYDLLKKIIKDLKQKEKLVKDKEKIKEEIRIFTSVLELFNVSKDAYEKKIEEIKFKIKEDINQEVSKTINIGSIILFFILLLIIIKVLTRKFLSEDERYYRVNKVINVVFFTVLIFILLFSYIENVDYLITILGFASAGIAIAMKDWFMSLMGWIVIFLGNSVHVGDRIKVVREGNEYVGDIIDISLLRITIQEDITLTTVTHNRRAGRIIFIPNNFIFTDMIANYSHSELKTVWDGIDIIITFDSNIQKTSVIVKEVIKKYSKGYTDMTRKQINKMRGQYSIKNTAVEPRVYSSIEDYGIKISGWYLTNSFATLTLRTTISTEIIELIQKEEDIHIAYPTQTLFIKNNIIKKIKDEE